VNIWNSYETSDTVVSGAATGALPGFSVSCLVFCRVSTVVVQRFCKPKVVGSNPSPGTNDFRYLQAALHHFEARWVTLGSQ
jgi:hypothetical protein